MVAKASKSEGVTRIKASGGKNRTENKAPKKAAKTKTQDADVEKKRRFPGNFFGYFVGSWKELRQVHWPTRRATWGLTGAVLAFSAFFVIFILVLDAIFKYVFETILK